MVIDLIWDTLSEEWPTWLLFGLCVAVFVYATRQRPDWRALVGIACYAVALLYMNFYRAYPSGTDEQLHHLFAVWGTANHAALAHIYLPALFACYILFPPEGGRRAPGYGLGVLIWLMVIVAELWTSVAENINCNFWQTDIPFDKQTEEQKAMSVCERIYGPVYTFVPLLVQIAFMGLATWLFGWASAINRRLRETR